MPYEEQIPNSLQGLDEYLDKNTLSLFSGARYFNLCKYRPHHYSLDNSGVVGEVPYTDLSAALVAMVMQMSKDVNR